MLAKKTTKNQLTLPKEIVRQFPEVDYFDIAVKNQKIILTPVKLRPINLTLENIQDKMAKLGITKTDVDKAVTWARKRK